MSSQLASYASSHGSFVHHVWKQISTNVPPIPSNIDLEGKTVLVTGSNVGLGLECARHFLGLRPKLLLMAVRSLERGEAAAAGLRTEFPQAKIKVWELDMASFRSVQDFAARCERELDRLHVAVLNAGLVKDTFQRVEEGGRREATIQVNYLSTALLAMLLLPKMKPTASATEPGRLTIVSSDASLRVKLDDPGNGALLDSFDRPEKFEGIQQYSISKLLEVMFVAKLAKIVDPEEIIINTSNPGTTKGTGFLGNMKSGIMKVIFSVVLGFLGRTPAEAAKIYVHSSLVLGKESHGSYTEWNVRAWPITMYTDHGSRMSDKLWDETMQELSFAKLEGILNEFRK